LLVLEGVKDDTVLTNRNGKWRVKSTHKAFENEFFALFEDDVIKPTGENGTYAWIKFKTGASVLPIDDEGYVYVTRQFRYAIGRHDLEIVSGSVEGEGALDAAKRELKEELGIEAEEWIDMGSVYSLTSITQSCSRQFIARKLKFGEQETEGTEDIEQIKLTLEQAVDMVLNGEITDGDSCILILKAHAMKEKWQ
jgi:8-oxo-dGTP pyrophosphatase MutT (NUDIX family)